MTTLLSSRLTHLLPLIAVQYNQRIVSLTNVGVIVGGTVGGLVLILLVILIFGAAQKTPTRQKSSFLPPTLGTHNRTYVHSVSHPGRDAVREIIPYRIIGRSRKRGGEDSMNFDKLDSDIGSGLQVKTVAR